MRKNCIVSHPKDALVCVVGKHHVALSEFLRSSKEESILEHLAGLSVGTRRRDRGNNASAFSRRCARGMSCDALHLRGIHRNHLCCVRGPWIVASTRSHSADALPYSRCLQSTPHARSVPRDDQRCEDVGCCVVKSCATLVFRIYT